MGCVNPSRVPITVNYYPYYAGWAASASSIFGGNIWKQEGGWFPSPLVVSSALRPPLRYLPPRAEPIQQPSPERAARVARVARVGLDCRNKAVDWLALDLHPDNPMGGHVDGARETATRP